MATSTIPAVKRALLARLQADANLAGVTVSWQTPYPAVPSSGECVGLGNSISDDAFRGSPYGAGQTAASIGRLAREERYGIEVFVHVRTSVHDGQQACTERAFVLAGYVETSIRTWALTTPAAFDGACAGAFVVSLTHAEGVLAGDPSQCGCDVRIVVGCRARI